MKSGQDADNTCYTIWCMLDALSFTQSLPELQSKWNWSLEVLPFTIW